MSVWAIAMVKDEVDVIEPVLRHVAAQGVDGILVADNGSTDGTYDALLAMHHELDCDMTVIPDDEVGYWQSRKMTVLANAAHSYSGATWVWPFDADELWYHDAAPLAEIVEQQEADVIQTRLWHHFPTALDDRVDEYEQTPANPFERMRYRGAAEAPIGKVIVRWKPGAVIEAGNHAATLPGSALTIPSAIQVRHFPYRSEDQFVRKAINGSRAYAATDLPWGTGQHWREYGVHYQRGGEEALRAIYREHFFYDLPSASGLVYDPARLDS